MSRCWGVQLGRIGEHLPQLVGQVGEGGAESLPIGRLSGHVPNVDAGDLGSVSAGDVSIDLGVPLSRVADEAELMVWVPPQDRLDGGRLGLSRIGQEIQNRRVSQTKTLQVEGGQGKARPFHEPPERSVELPGARGDVVKHHSGLGPSTVELGHPRGSDKGPSEGVAHQRLFVRHLGDLDGVVDVADHRHASGSDEAHRGHRAVCAHDLQDQLALGGELGGLRRRYGQSAVEVATGITRIEPELVVTHAYHEPLVALVVSQKGHEPVVQNGPGALVVADRDRLAGQLHERRPFDGVVFGLEDPPMDGHDPLLALLIEMGGAGEQEDLLVAPQR